MIECNPRGIFSWNFDLAGEGHQAFAEFNWLGEQGALVIDGENHRVMKHGIFSGRWTLESASGTVFSADKTNPFTRTFEISGPGGLATLRAQSPVGRTMVVEGGGTALRIAPAHPFTRRAAITGAYQDFRLVSFAFWLAVLTWRRSANSGAGAAS